MKSLRPSLSDCYSGTHMAHYEQRNLDCDIMFSSNFEYSEISFLRHFDQHWIQGFLLYLCFLIFFNGLFHAFINVSAVKLHRPVCK